ncbi:hypothetical protein PRK78_003960 [Emydomyces testavorans]|uniref:Uncharacterized protein n=1 Tax=Emydomyces testavorans TaxID=2070801 RepID=A0AAF0DJ15_9EURO|nr:hypothetical protein PRK78_003960 [Emydomyces testavorans]
MFSQVAHWANKPTESSGLRSPSLGTPPAFAAQLTPYIKTRDEVLRIRRTLTLYLQAQVTLSNDTPVSHSTLCAPHNVVGIKRIPPEFGNGLRAQYLKALQANVAVRKEYDGLLEEINALTEKVGRCDTKESSDAQGQELQTYLSLLRSRQQLRKIQICQHFLDKLNAMEAAGPDYLDINRETKHICLLPKGLSAHQEGSRNTASQETQPDTLLHELERAVLVAKSQTDNEKRHLTMLKAHAQSRQGREPSICPQVRLKALMRTRDELVQWVENTLVASGMEDASVIEGEAQRREGRDGNESQVSRERLKAEIEQLYIAYLSARRKLLDAVSATSCLPMKSPFKAKHTASQYQESEQSSTDFSIVFPYVYENVSSILKAQRATTVQNALLSALLSKERWTAAKVLERLQNESHLLPEYPILARQPRFKHTVAAINSRSDIGGSPLTQTQASEIVTHAEAWAFASGAAHDTTKGHIDGQLAIGTEMAKSAEGTLRGIYEIMNQDYDDLVSPQDTTKESEEDIWTMDAKVFKGRTVSGRLDKRSKGPWSGLHGKVGVISD